MRDREDAAVSSRWASKKGTVGVGFPGVRVHGGASAFHGHFRWRRWRRRFLMVKVVDNSRRDVSARGDGLGWVTAMWYPSLHIPHGTGNNGCPEHSQRSQYSGIARKFQTVYWAAPKKNPLKMHGWMWFFGPSRQPCAVSFGGAVGMAKFSHFSTHWNSSYAEAGPSF
jgi:hypothetical protein